MILPASTSETLTYDTMTDEELVRRFKEGDEKAFTEIVIKYRTKIFRVALNFIRKRTDAEEIAQDTFIRAYRCMKDFRGDSTLSTWLHRIATNLSRNRYWYLFRRKRYDSVSMDCPLGEDGKHTFGDTIADDNAETAGDEMVTSELAEIVARCRKKLTRSHQEILSLLVDNHMSYGEIGEALFMEVGTVKSRIARARNNLQEFVLEELAERH